MTEPSRRRRPGLRGPGQAGGGRANTQAPWRLWPAFVKILPAGSASARFSPAPPAGGETGSPGPGGTPLPGPSATATINGSVTG